VGWSRLSRHYLCDIGLCASQSYRTGPAGAVARAASATIHSGMTELKVAMSLDREQIAQLAGTVGAAAPTGTEAGR
jgi:hypothetical protein